MKKILVLMTTMIMLFGLVGVMALNGTVNVGEQAINFTLSPETLNFSAIIAGETGSSQFPIGFNVTSANVNVTLEVTNVTGDTILDNIMVRNTGSAGNWSSIIHYSGIVPCVEAGTPPVCTYPDSLSWDAQLTVPSGTPPGTQSAAITYTINGVPPA